MIPDLFTRLELIKNKVKINNKPIVLNRKTLKKVLDQINKGGVTYCPLLEKDYARTEHISVSPFPERSQVFTGKITARVLKSYCLKNSDLFKSGFSLGAWFDSCSLMTYLDISAPIPLSKSSEAITLGKGANQIAGFNLMDLSEVQLGGTGEFNLSMIAPFGERLNEALSLMSN